MFTWQKSTKEKKKRKGKERKNKQQHGKSSAAGLTCWPACSASAREFLYTKFNLSNMRARTGRLHCLPGVKAVSAITTTSACQWRSLSTSVYWERCTQCTRNNNLLSRVFLKYLVFS